MKQFPVLTAKIKMPSPRKNSIIRKTLFEKISNVKNHKVTVIKAGAGSGKTTLLSQFFMNQKNVRFLTLDENLNQIFVFWKYLLFILKDFYQKDDEFEQCFQDAISMELLQNMIFVLADKIEDQTDKYLVFDDFQYIREPLILETMNLFLTNIPSNLHVIFASRMMPQLYFGNFSMEGQLLIIEEQDFVFSREESMAFFQKTLELKNTPIQLEQMISKSNGWVGGMQLLAISKSEENQEKLFESESQKVVWDYVNQEIYQHLSKSEQEFLKCTAILDAFDETICKQLLPEISFSKTMEQLISKNMFIIHVDDEKGQFRYHSILKDFLLHLFDETQSQKQEYCKKAAELYEKMGEIETAIQLYFAAEEYESLIELFLSLPQDAVICGYIMQVPLEEISRNVDFAFQYFFCYYTSMDMDRCKKIYEYILQNTKEKQIVKAFLDSDLFFDVNWEFKKVTVFTPEQIEKLPLNDVTKSYVYIKDAYFLFIEDRLVEALEYLDKVTELYKKTKNIYIYAYILSEKAQILEDQGHFTEALCIYPELFSCTRKMKSFRSFYYIGIAGLHIRQYELKQAWEELELAKESIELKIDSISSAYLYTLAEWYYTSNQAQKTEDLLLQIFQDKLYDSIFFKARILRYPIYRHKNKELSDTFFREYVNADEILKNMDTDLLYTGILFEKGRNDEAFQLIHNLIAKGRKEKNYLKIIEGSLLKARIVYQTSKDKRMITDCIAESISYAFKDKIKAPFWFEREFVEMSMEEFSTDIKAKLTKEMLSFIQKTIAEMKKGFELPEKKENPFQLTDREMEVLELLKEGYANKQIGDMLCISLATVKTHILNIYGKLEVNNRVAALNKTRNMQREGIISFQEK